MTGAPMTAALTTTDVLVPRASKKDNAGPDRLVSFNFLSSGKLKYIVVLFVFGPLNFYFNMHAQIQKVLNLSKYSFTIELLNPTYMELMAEFVPAIEEVLGLRVSPDYFQYLRHKLERIAPIR